MSTFTLSPTKPNELTALFGIDNHLHFQEGPGGFTIAHLASSHGKASISVYGGHVLTYHPTGHEPVLWVSDLAKYEVGKAIRGGIPVIWPWFGPHESDHNKPSHGFARNQQWEVHSTRLIDGTSPQIRLTLQDNALSHLHWPHAFRLELIVTLTEVLDVSLVVINIGDNPFDCQGALHTYLNVSDISDASISGLEESSYVDQLANMEVKTQSGPITFNAETDNIHFETRATCQLKDAGLNRQISVEKRGSSSTVVWNPWIDKAKRMADFGDDEYKTMVCIETANAGPDKITINPGGEHVLGTTLSAS